MVVLGAALGVFAALTTVWAASELWLGWSRRSGDRSRSRDSGTLRLLLVTVYAVHRHRGLAVSSAPMATSAPSRMPLFWIGLLLMAAGMALRFWSIRVLAQFLHRRCHHPRRP